MRSFKFRAYNKRLKTMDFGSGDLLLRINDKDSSKPQQFTGLLDKNGKEIYEGDVLKTHEHIDCVVWRDDLCGFSYKNDKSRMNLVDWLENGQYSGTTIIGNIFENEDLLNALKK